MHLRRLFGCLVLILASTSLFAQQTGALHGRVTASDGSALPGVTVEARSNVLPQPRVTVTDANGDYRLPQLQPGAYTLTFTLSGMATATRNVEALLGQDNAADVKMGVGGVSENITVTAQQTLVDKESTAIQSGLSSQQIRELPVAQEYRDLQKLIPGVMYSQDLVRGPSAGGSGQSNVYLFDGANVSLPFYGTLSSDASTHDIAQVNIVRGGAKAVDFNRSGGFQIDSVSKSGTNKFTGEAEYQILNHGMIAAQAGTVNSIFQQDRHWATVDGGGPILSDRLFFYGSYYHPTYTRQNQANLTGPLPEYKSDRNEEFGKLTFTPTSNWLVNGSYRTSHTRETSGNGFGTRDAGTTGSGNESHFKLGILEASWVMSPKSFSTFKFSDYKNPTAGRPDTAVNAPVSFALGSQLDIANLGNLGLLTVPTPLSTNAAQAAFVQPFIDKYGYVCPQNPAAVGLTCVAGTHVGGGTVGFASLNDQDDFARRSGQAGYNFTLGRGLLTHDFHVGYQRYQDTENLLRTSNGLGSISIIGGASQCTAAVCGTAQPIFFQATLQGQSIASPTIHSEFHSANIELNDTIHRTNWTYNLGVMLSHDQYYGQGLAKADNLAGFTRSIGTKYLMHDFGFRQMIQPRLGATWAYNEVDTIFASYATYNQAASSLPRAASWDRGLQNQVNVDYDANGKLIGIDPVGASAGKLFVPGIKPPETREFILGTSRQLNSEWSVRAYARHRYAHNFMEDTPNNERVCLSPFLQGANIGQCGPSSFPSDAPADIPHQPYIPDFPARLNAIGGLINNQFYVVANLDGAFTKYYEATTETEWHHRNLTFNGSYTWSHYYGNFDQDNTSPNSTNDANRFIGSSNIADAAGRNIWNYKYGDLRGDRRNVVKLSGTYALPWRATTGAFFVYQSGQPYQIESYLPYSTITTSTSDTDRFAEPAGRRRTPSYNQMDLNYTQSLPLVRSFNMQLVFDLYNVMNHQTGYNYESRVGTLGTCDPTKSSTCFYTGLTGPQAYLKQAPYPNSYYAPRRFQVAARVAF
jgi:hypothetical protein